ncbi:hypothetical protein SLA2020_020370 [Shorea laevis]
MQFKDSFVIERHACVDPYLRKSQGIDCCSWEGIWCNQYIGHITGLDLSSSCLFGSINSNSSLFCLSNLEYLNLSGSLFYGQVPQEISKLSRLAKLDLSFNLDYSYQGLLELKNLDLNSLIHNFTRLE